MRNVTVLRVKRLRFIIIHAATFREHSWEEEQADEVALKTLRLSLSASCTFEVYN